VLGPANLTPANINHRGFRIVPSKLDVDRLEFVVLAEKAEITRVPLVASFSHYGTAVRDIPREFEAADERCRRRGLIDQRGKVNDDVWEMLGIYSHTSLEYDLRFSSKKGTELRAAVSQSGEVAVRTVIDGDRIVLDRMRATDMIPSLHALLPEHKPAKVQPLSVDLAGIRAAMQEAERRGETDQRSIEHGLRTRGIEIGEYRKMTQLLDGPKLGAGEVGVTVWGRHRKELRGDQTLRVVDLESGRVSLYNSAGRRMLAGCDIGTFKRVLGGIASQTQRTLEW
jgi:hypothetical protein